MKSESIIAKILRLLHYVLHGTPLATMNSEIRMLHTISFMYIMVSFRNIIQDTGQHHCVADINDQLKSEAKQTQR